MAHGSNERQTYLRPIPYLIYRGADRNGLRERIVQRSRAGNDASEADLAVLQHQLESEEPLDTDEQADIVIIDA